jgi:hypothetical protein
MSQLPHYTVKADRETGQWLSEPVASGKTVSSDEWAAKPDIETEVYVTYEHDLTDTRHGIDDRWPKVEWRALTLQWVPSRGVWFEGRIIDYDAAVMGMDDELREQLHSSRDWPDEEEPNQAFFDAYLKAHEEKFGEEFEL